MVEIKEIKQAEQTAVIVQGDWSASTKDHSLIPEYSHNMNGIVDIPISFWESRALLTVHLGEAFLKRNQLRRIILLYV
jgi:hypothetical protein